MADRKVLVKYYPPDFDPSKLGKHKGPKGGLVPVRTMMNMTICCNNCGDYIYRGKKFNAKKQQVQGEDYLGIKVFRFYLKCPNCSSKIVIKTDPKNGDYVCESGATRNFEPWKSTAQNDKEILEEREAEEIDAMKKLENRTIESKFELETTERIGQLEDIQADKSHITSDHLIQLHDNNNHKEESDDDLKIKAVFGDETYDEEEIFEEKKPGKSLFSILKNKQNSRKRPIHLITKT